MVSSPAVASSATGQVGAFGSTSVSGPGQNRAAARHAATDRPAPHRGVVDAEAGDEILVFAGRHAVFHESADDLVAGASRAVPGAVLGGKGAAVIFGAELVAGIERHPERCRVR